MCSIKEQTVQRLLDTDKEFCQKSLISKEKAWEKYIADEAVMVSGGHRPYITGKENIVKALSSLYSLNGLQFIWEPQIADVSDDFTMGFTSGLYTREYIQEGKNMKEIGKYTTVWKKIGNAWKIVLDIGNEEIVES